MTKQEFEHLVGQSVSDDNYEVIEMVYAHHPSIREVEGKYDIAAIYRLHGGMRIIRDMVDTAMEACRWEEDIQRLSMELDRARDELAELST